MTRVAAGLVVLLAALMQVTWAPQLTVLGAFPNLVLVLVVVITWTRGQRAGLVSACGGGLLLDLTAPGPLGAHALALLAAAYLVGFWVRNVDPAQLVHAVIATAACTAVYSLVLIGADNLLDLPMPPLDVAAQLAVTAAAYNAILVVPALLLGRRRRVRPA
ncbi:MAG TPA: rod shape-determining protein MreD [Candidatus Dormibacteraeota bacterium]|nr:rod shape-determining protein MreD [Candidatus Dormibacteraeota bacterium]